jgi:hypothetical protein
MLGVSRQRVGQLVATELTFPRHVTEISGGRIWYRAGIELWIAGHRPSRVQSAGRFAGEAGELLRVAEDESRSRGDGWVDALHLWLAMGQPEPSGVVGRALGSMSVTLDELRRAVAFTFDRVTETRRAVRMNPRVQEHLEDANRRAERARRSTVIAPDIALALLDGHDAEPRQMHFPAYLTARGLDTVELRRRINRLVLHPDARLPARSLPKPPPRRRKPRRPAWLDLMANPLGHDPWDRHPWGAAFAVDQAGRHLTVDDESWFFTTDADGFFIRLSDGRPLGYRYRVIREPPKPGDPAPKPVNGFMEALPMPPPDVAYWPDYRFARDD